MKEQMRVKDDQILRMIAALQKEREQIGHKMRSVTDTTDLRSADLVINAMVSALYAALSIPK